MSIKIICGDSLVELKKLSENSVDSICCDPPYGLSFMGKKWDYDVPSVEMWKEALRVLKPGGHLLSFGGSRTYHRMAVAIEDAGFEIRDQIMYVYGSGFPKSLNIGKAVDKLQGNKREDLGKSPASRDNAPNHTVIARGAFSGDARITKGSSPYEGWGTALKPSHEPIVVARKPLSESTIAENVLKWGTGGINIDGCRVGTETTRTTIKDLSQAHGNQFGKAGIKYPTQGYKDNPPGRFPANFIHDGSDEVVGLFPDTGKSTGGNSGVRGNDVYGKYGDSQLGVNPGFGDSGSAARFFYCAKASKKDRNEGLEGFEEKQTTGGGGLTAGFREDGSYETASAGGKYGSIKAKQTNSHPTVKPTALMQYLVRFVTPVGGTVLDCFMGSGSTGKACVLEGFDFIGIEIEKEYCDIATARIAFLQEKKLNKPLLI